MGRYIIYFGILLLLQFKVNSNINTKNALTSLKGEFLCCGDKLNLYIAVNLEKIVLFS